MFALDDAPKRMDSILGRPQTYSIASFGLMAPPPSTCIATALNFFVLNVVSYISLPPDILNPALLIDAQTIGLDMPACSSTSTSFGMFMVIKPASALYFFLI